MSSPVFPVSSRVCVSSVRLETDRLVPRPQSPDGKRVAMSSETGQIYIFDVASSSLASTYTSHAMAVRSLAWSPDCNVRRPLRFRMQTAQSFTGPHLCIGRQAVDCARRAAISIRQAGLRSRRDDLRPLFMGTQRGHLTRLPLRTVRVSHLPYICLPLPTAHDTVAAP